MSAARGGTLPPPRALARAPRPGRAAARRRQGLALTCPAAARPLTLLCPPPCRLEKIQTFFGPGIVATLTETDQVGGCAGWVACGVR